MTPIRGHWAFSDMRRTHLSRLSTRLRREQLRQSPQVDRRGGEREEQLDARQAPQLHLSQRAVLLGIAEHGLDQLAGDLAQAITRMARGALIDAARPTGSVLRDVR